MSLGTLTVNAVYSTLIAEAAMFIDESGRKTAVRVIPGFESADLLPELDTRIRGARRGFFMLKTATTFRPRQGETIVHGGRRYCLADSAEDYSEEEWFFTVTAVVCDG